MFIFLKLVWKPGQFIRSHRLASSPYRQIRIRSDLLSLLLSQQQKLSFPRISERQKKGSFAGKWGGGGGRGGGGNWAKKPWLRDCISTSFSIWLIVLVVGKWFWRFAASIVSLPPFTEATVWWFFLWKRSAYYQWLLLHLLQLLSHPFPPPFLPSDFRKK